MITVVDLKGHTFNLDVPFCITCSPQGLTEMWFEVDHEWIPNYDTIVVPIFDDWWVDPQWETRWS